MFRFKIFKKLLSLISIAKVIFGILRLLDTVSKDGKRMKKKRKTNRNWPVSGYNWTRAFLLRRGKRETIRQERNNRSRDYVTSDRCNGCGINSRYRICFHAPNASELHEMLIIGTVRTERANSTYIACPWRHALCPSKRKQ